MPALVAAVGVSLNRVVWMTAWLPSASRRTAEAWPWAVTPAGTPRIQVARESG
ncbi:hypothetical protein ACIRVK_35815 [Streptomyces sp. NPDC101152]|uniref:hypothetical protein n=1 Tax=Streptomyces sp. NPDC101152 TaxID=3366116 RepID=UPI00381DF914